MGLKGPSLRPCQFPPSTPLVFPQPYVLAPLSTSQSPGVPLVSCYSFISTSERQGEETFHVKVVPKCQQQLGVDQAKVRSRVLSPVAHVVPPGVWWREAELGVTQALP